MTYTQQYMELRRDKIMRGLIQEIEFFSVEEHPPEIEDRVLLLNGGNVDVGMLTMDENGKEIWSDRPFDHGSPFKQFHAVTHWAKFQKPIKP